MKFSDRISSLFLIALSAFVLIGSYKLGIGTLHNLGTGFMPFLASALLFILSLLILSGVGRKSEETNARPPAGWEKNLLKPGSLIIALLVYMLLLNHLGYILAAFFLLSQMFFISERRKWFQNIFSSAMIAVLSFMFFRWLQVQLPAGVLHIRW